MSNMCGAPVLLSVPAVNRLPCTVSMWGSMIQFEVLLLRGLVQILPDGVTWAYLQLQGDSLSTAYPFHMLEPMVPIKSLMPGFVVRW